MKTLDLSGDRRLAYWDTGNGRPLVFIHGVGTTGEIWARDLAVLAVDCRLIVHDRRGYNASSASPRDWKAHADDVIDLVEALDAAPAVIVGYSGGAIVALDLALRRPELASRLVLVDPAFNLMRCMTPGFLRHLATVQLLRRVRGARHGAAHWMRYVASDSTGGSAFTKAAADRRERILANAEAIFHDMASGGGGHVDESKLAQVAIPTVIVEASRSPSFLRRSCARLRRLMPQAQVRTLDASHHVMLDARDEMLAILRDAITSSPA